MGRLILYYIYFYYYFNNINFNPLSAIPTEWAYTVKQFVGNSQRIVLSLFDNFVGFTLIISNIYRSVNHAKVGRFSAEYLF